MDFELFNFDEDDDLLSTACIEATQDHLTAPQQTQAFDGVDEDAVLPELHCSGEDTTHAQFASEGFVRSGFMLTRPEYAWHNASESLKFTEFEFGVKQLHGHNNVQYLIGTSWYAHICKEVYYKYNICVLLFSMQIQHLWASVRQPLNTNDTYNYRQRRKEVTHMFYWILHHTTDEQWSLLRPSLESMRRLVNRTTEADTWKLIYFANSCKGNDCNAAAYHLLHGVLEWKLLDLCILYKFELCAPTVLLDGNAKSSSAFISQLTLFFEDLVTCSLYLYGKKRPAELLYASPFPCTCIKECWLYVQLALQKWTLTALAVAGEQLTFWQLFNETIAKLKTNLGE